MPVIDIILLLVFGFAAVVGYRKGFIAQAGAIAAIVAGIIACRVFGPAATDFLMPDGDVETNSMPRYAASAIAYCGVYIVAYYAVVLVARLLKLVTHTLLLGPLDRIGGALVGMLKWGLVISLLLNLYLACWPDGKLLSGSKLADGKPVEWVVGLAPGVLGALSHPSAGSDTGTTSSSTDI